MEDAFRNWIKQCVERELAIKRQNKENGWKEGDAEYVTPENPAKELRVLISQYSSAIESIKNIYDINEKYYDEIEDVKYEQNINNLQSGQVVTLEYEVRVKNDTKE